MRIVQIIPSFGMGGAETMCAALSRQLLLDGHQVSAISLSGEKTVISQRLEASGVPVYPGGDDAQAGAHGLNNGHGHPLPAGG